MITNRRGCRTLWFFKGCGFWRNPLPLLAQSLPHPPTARNSPINYSFRHGPGLATEPRRAPKAQEMRRTGPMCSYSSSFPLIIICRSLNRHTHVEYVRVYTRLRHDGLHGRSRDYNIEITTRRWLIIRITAILHRENVSTWI